MERIAELVHALPASGVSVEVADVAGAAVAVAWLNAHGRPARLVPVGEVRETRLWDPSPGLLPVLEQLSPGRALDLGCGTGRDAVALALGGWEVVAVDRLPDALDRARSLAALHGVDLELLALDVEREPLPSGPFDLVTAFRYLSSLTRMASALRVGASLVVETFTDRERLRSGKPRDAALVLPAEGPPPLPAGMRLLEYRVATHGEREFATLWAVRER